MIFLTENDIKTHIYQRFVDESQADFPTRLDNIELENIDMIKSKLTGKYDVDAIFAKTENARDKLIIKCLATFCIYDLILTNAARKIPESFELLYERMNQWINDVRDGKETPELDLIVDETELDIIHGSSINDDYYI